MEKITTRFAPSPTGYLHIGHLRTALYGSLFAQQNGGVFILRIEDTDQTREVEGATEAIVKALGDAGILYHEGLFLSSGKLVEKGKRGPYVQSKRTHIYKEYAHKLVELGGAYFCFCTKDRIEALKKSDPFAKYDKHCLGLDISGAKDKVSTGEPYVIRQNVVQDGIASEYDDLLFGKVSVPKHEIEDGVMLKADGFPTYNFANVVDDHLMSVTHVIRGVEYLSSTPKFNLLYDAFKWKRPTYIHLQPIMKDERKKLSKRDGAATFEDFIAAGYLKDAIINYVALLGWSPKDNKEKLSFAELQALFSLKGLSKSPSIFDADKLKWLNSLYIKELSESDFLKIAQPFLEKSKPYAKLSKGVYNKKALPAILQKRLDTLADIPTLINFIEEFGAFDTNLFKNEKMKTTPGIAKDIIQKALPLLSKTDAKGFTAQNLGEALKPLTSANKGSKMDIKGGAEVEAQGVVYKAGQVYSTLRLALSSKEASAGGALELAEVLGKDESLKRLEFTLGLLT
ncbi:MAG: glutamate--tRNA ligase [Firmicutes bacterium]|nr:glutamate--tRNA ligase [Bacillota bacterium]